MGLLKWTVMAFFLMAGTAGAAEKSADAYTGQDGGYLVYSVGTIAIGMKFAFPYQRVALTDGTAVTDWPGSIEPRVGGAWVLKVKDPDFTGRETGHVVVRRLPPGRYTIKDFSFHGMSPVGDVYDWSAGTPFLIPFTINPGHTTYIGSFMRAPSLGTSLEAKLGAAGFFVISDQSARDLPIARAKVPGLPEADVQVTDVDSFGNPALRSREP